MRIFGFEISRLKSLPASLANVLSGYGWLPLIREPSTGAWQRNQELRGDSLLSYFAIYACMTLIGGDIGKLRPTVQRKDGAGIWKDAEFGNVTTLLKRPNRFQNHSQFKAYWVSSLLRAGNTYVLKQRNSAGVIVALYVLDPTRVQVLVATDGSVYYQLNQDDLSGVPESSLTVPASEIIHDRLCCLFHPLVGVPPLFANGLAASQGNIIQHDSLKFFGNGAKPGGMLTAPGAISDDTALRLKTYFEENFTGENSGRIAVAGDGLSYSPMKMTALDAQLVEQLRLTVDIVCATYHVPVFKLGFGQLPAGSKIEDLNLIYYTDCLQSLIESMELSLAEGLDLPDGYRVEFDLSGLLRMDTATQYKTLGEAIKGSLMKPDEARARVNLPALPGGDTIYMQQQNYSLAALAKRDAQADPFAPGGGNVAPSPEVEQDNEDLEAEKLLHVFATKSYDLPVSRFSQ